MRLSLFWDVTQRKLVLTDVSEQPIGPIFKGQAVEEYPSRSGWPFYMGPIGYPETSVTDYQYTLLNISQERRTNVWVPGNAYQLHLCTTIGHACCITMNYNCVSISVCVGEFNVKWTSYVISDTYGYGYVCLYQADQNDITRKVPAVVLCSTFVDVRK
jgi:hypothetical protein